ncbi:GNAT family N-acetyltransferase [Grimontia sp. NTOU-MAR1]|uniref:GNAT family N-acetyltransferase n=1 Tax=Grimontia sp. NTOU-MAR1 TaxID=3111011 RepID=UPI002DC051DE|nr:GNAT family N-acetyltransferase [Grimontia sp. NTOU-MAR1]WRW00410.1 GNAT family N-acetyltransferase [Grimontia sp. NTOU-MAR1]
MDKRIELIDYHPRYTEQTISMWRSSKERALGIPEAHDLEAHRYYLNRILTASNRVYLALEKRSERVLGMIAFDQNFITQLYVDCDYQNQGIGSVLVDLAKETTSQNLQLYTFEMNAPARRFWKKHGFEEKQVGQHNNEEGLVDVLCEWQREDEYPELRYAFS